MQMCPLFKMYLVCICVHFDNIWRYEVNLIYSNIKYCVFAVQQKGCYEYSLLFTLKLDKLTSGFAHKSYF